MTAFAITEVVALLKVKAGIMIVYRTAIFEILRHPVSFSKENVHKKTSMKSTHNEKQKRS